MNLIPVGRQRFSDCLRPWFFAFSVALGGSAGMSLLPSVAHAQTTTGAVEGRVLNVVTASYLNNARVRVRGTSLETFTNAFGEFRLPSVPAGPIELEVYYTGFAPRVLPVTVEAGQSTRQNVELGARPPASPDATSADDGDAVVLSEFVVSSSRETNAAAIAINEQRFAANLKSVVSTDAFGSTSQGNIGEFLKHVPGVTIEYAGQSASGIQVRGFNSNYTAVTVDGGTIASAASPASTQNHSRAFGLEQASINNYSRIEVVKQPTPDMPSNLLGGAVNLVTKSAFEVERPILNFDAYLSANSDEISFEKTPGPERGEDLKVLPSFSLTYVLPVNDRFGVVVSAGHSNTYLRTLRTVPTRQWNDPTPATPRDLAADVRTSAFAGDTVLRTEERNSASVKFDWKPLDRHVLSLTLQANAFRGFGRTQRMSYNAATLTAWGEDFSTGAQVSGANANQSVTADLKHGLTHAGGVRYTFDGDDWEIEFGGNLSRSRNRNSDGANGFFRGYNARALAVNRIEFTGIDNEEGTPGTIALFANGTPVQPTQLVNYTLQNATTQPSTATDTLADLRLNVTRHLDFLPFTLALKAGGSFNQLERDIDYDPRTYTFVGADGAANSADDVASQFLDPLFSGFSPGYSYPALEWADPWAIYENYLAHPGYWAQTASQQNDTIRNGAVRSPLLEETVTAYYFMFDARFLRNRVRFVGGVRYEDTENEGDGMLRDDLAIYQRDSAGTLLRDPQGRYIRRTDIGAPGSPQETSVIYTKRGLHNRRSYDGYYPSGHLTVNLTEDLLLRAAYAKTIGRPRLVDVVPNITVTPPTDPSAPGAQGSISAANSTLEPWSADNFDLSLEYYLPNSGVVSAGVFRKDITDFFGSITTVADEALLDALGLSHEFVGYRYTTRVNAGDARIDGFEVNYRQNLAFLGPWAQPFSVFANATKLKLEGSREADFDQFIPETANLGLEVSWKRFYVLAKYNYRGKQRREYRDDFPGAEENIRAYPTVDAEISYRLTEHFALFLTGRNIFDEPYRWEVVGPDLPSWAALTSNSNYGVQYTFGVKGSF